MKACFIGHRKIQVSEELISSLEQIVVDLIHKGVKTFLFGSMSEFDNVSWSTVTKLKNAKTLQKFEAFNFFITNY